MGNVFDGQVRQLVADSVELVWSKQASSQMGRSRVFEPDVRQALRLCVVKPMSASSYLCEGRDRLGRILRIEVRVTTLRGGAYRRDGLVVLRVEVHRGELDDEL